MATKKTFRISSVEYDKPTKLNNIDLANCILCQEIIDEKRICPFDSKRLNVGAGYQSLADNIKKFHELRLMPEGINVCIENLDEGSGIAQSFIDQKACWHKSCNLKLNRTKLDRAVKPTSHERIDNKATISKKKSRHSFSVQSTSNPSVCFFCNENGQEALHESSTFGQDTRVKEYAVKLNDTLLLAKLSAGDLIAREAKYHSKCFVSLYNRASRIEMKNDNVESKKESQIHGIAFSELVSYINETRSCDETIRVYKLSDLCNLYMERITCLEDVQGVVQTFDQSEPMLKCQSNRVSLLPESYSNLPPAELRFSEPDIPLVEGELSIDMSSFPAALKGEFKWLNSCR
ncbi:unnamed protein product [Mytilus edulis]|uniref:Uncharacterized protein n=1 Tax=Mytilus edulis TaxID=6550 RepID=A0A8S3RGI1_MYTED|nr:unnamed protein product [Mytilus edulis]